ncbi:hypothetical protein ACIQ7Q_24425 [Streptomyces sp. NPDC096176]|uniref:hypothetical protein n=1 Tax=Streptomyces sp. NPDC096176 TaxID=3366079 RepID=UPI003815A8C8
MFPPAGAVVIKSGQYADHASRAGPPFRRADGAHRVTGSVDDWLTRHNIAHQIQPLWPKHPRFNPHGRRRADWQLTNGTYLECASLSSDDYVAKIRAKQHLARETGIRLVVIRPPDSPT